MKNKFNTDGFTVIEGVIPKDIAYFCERYIRLKQRVLQTFIDKNYVSPFQFEHGWIQDPDVENSFGLYGDVAMEVLLVELLPAMQEIVGAKLVPTYAYARMYHPNSILYKHKDRDSCEISTTLNLGGDPWPIYINPNPQEGAPPQKGPSTSKGIKIDLKPGDMLVYKGKILEHWREIFKGKSCFQVFLHYNRKDAKENNLFDGRPHLGLPDDI